MTDLYQPHFNTIPREGKLAIWVKMPDDSLLNIWDLPEKDLTQAVKSAIAIAFDRGIAAGKYLCAPDPYFGSLGTDVWEKPQCLD